MMARILFFFFMIPLAYSSEGIEQQLPLDQGDVISQVQDLSLEETRPALKPLRDILQEGLNDFQIWDYSRSIVKKRMFEEFFSALLTDTQLVYKQQARQWQAFQRIPGLAAQLHEKTKDPLAVTAELMGIQLWGNVSIDDELLVKSLAGYWQQKSGIESDLGALIGIFLWEFRIQKRRLVISDSIFSGEYRTQIVDALSLKENSPPDLRQLAEGLSSLYHLHAKEMFESYLSGIYPRKTPQQKVQERPKGLSNHQKKKARRQQLRH